MASSQLPPPQLSERITRLTSSLVREILAAAQAPGMISFAGGLPSAEAMPLLRDMPHSHDWMSPVFQQYGQSEGEPILRARLADWLAECGMQVSPQQTLVLSGSQQGIDLAAKLFVDPGTPMLCEAPTYLAALQAFQLFGANCLGLPLTDDGIDPALLAQMIETHKPRAIYLIPTFQNPSGHCYSAENRRALAEVLDHYALPLIEDEPYRELMYDEVDRTPICSLLKRAPWIYLGSFSKTLWPGWRVGFLAASSDLFPHLLRLKQAGDLHTNRPGQIRVANWLACNERHQDLMNLRNTYRTKRDAMNNALTTTFGHLADWETPAGGLFFWLKLRNAKDTRPLLKIALEHNVVFMPGEAFYPASGEPAFGTMRLNFSHANADDMKKGLATLAKIFEEYK
ncbi:PLP-dependent aminotransferase family protein [Cellvibrio sp.]|uniref:aminotransferase-like domain-containing protein n=1 Tax=Cellvibrio sp. TaxID=1965322 RepID=UPI003964743A